MIYWAMVNSINHYFLEQNCPTKCHWKWRCLHICQFNFIWIFHEPKKKILFLVREKRKNASKNQYIWDNIVGIAKYRLDQYYIRWSGDQLSLELNGKRYSADLNRGPFINQRAKKNQTYRYWLKIQKFSPVANFHRKWKWKKKNLIFPVLFCCSFLSVPLEI